jgi:hypothetical protein
MRLSTSELIHLRRDDNKQRDGVHALKEFDFTYIDDKSILILFPEGETILIR